MMKVTLMKQSADGEQINFEVHIPSEAMKAATIKGDTVALDAHLFPLFHVADKRLLEMNQRVAAAKGVMDGFGPEVRMRVNQILEIIHGNVPTHQIKALIEEARQKRLEGAQVDGGQAQAAQVIDPEAIAGMEIVP